MPRDAGTRLVATLCNALGTAVIKYCIEYLSSKGLGVRLYATRAFDINKDIDKSSLKRKLSRGVELKCCRAFLTSPAFELKIKGETIQMQEQKSKRVPQSVLTLIVDDLKIAWSGGARFRFWYMEISKRISNQSKVNEYYRNWLLHLYEPEYVKTRRMQRRSAKHESMPHRSLAVLALLRSLALDSNRPRRMSMRSRFLLVKIPCLRSLPRRLSQWPTIRFPTRVRCPCKPLRMMLLLPWESFHIKLNSNDLKWALHRV